MRDWDYREICFLGQGLSGRNLCFITTSKDRPENPKRSLALICICLVACYGYMKFLKLDCWRSIYDQGFIDSKDQRVCISFISPQPGHFPHQKFQINLNKLANCNELPMQSNKVYFRSKLYEHEINSMEIFSSSDF